MIVSGLEKNEYGDPGVLWGWEESLTKINGVQQNIEKLRGDQERF